MRNRHKTIDSLRRLAERPGTKAEGETAKAMLERMLGSHPQPKPFNASDFPRGTEVFYNYWAYPINVRCVIVGKQPKIVKDRVWLSMRFSHLKQPRSVPVTSVKGCHISKAPLPPQDAEEMYYYWRE